MKKAWNKVSRVVSALLVLGMFASVVPAQVLAVDDITSQTTSVQSEGPVTEQTEKKAATEQMEGEPVAEQAGGELSPANGSDEETCTITVEFHKCINSLHNWKWSHEVRTTTMEVKESEMSDFWKLDAASVANMAVGDDRFSGVDFWLNGDNQPVRKGSGTSWTVELYVNIHAWGDVPDKYTRTYEEGDPWNENIVGEPLYRIQNLSSNLAVAYTFKNSIGGQSGYLAPGDRFMTSVAVDNTAAIIFFVKVPAGETSKAVEFSDNTKGEVFPLDEIDTKQGAYDFAEEIAQAKADGYTHAFYFTQWSNEMDRWFKVLVEDENPDPTEKEWTLTYDANGGKGEIASVTVKESETVTIANGSALKYDDHKFKGWNSQADGLGEEYAVDKSYTLTSNLTLYAQWEEITEPTPTKVGYTINYYKDSVAENNLLYTESCTGNVGDKIEYTPGAYLPGGYTASNPIVSGAETISANESENVLNVVYNRRTDLKYTVNYYKDSVADSNLVESVPGQGTFQEAIPYTAGAYLPDGYTSSNVTVSGATSIGADETKNVLNVVYGRRTDLSYTVYYIEDQTGKTLAGPDTVGGQTFGSTITAYAKDIAGYAMTSDKNPQTLTIGTGDNHLTFYYKEIGPDQPAVVMSVQPAATPAPVAPVTPRITTPTAGGTTAAGGTTVTAPAATAAPADNDAEEEPEEEVVPEEETPKAEEPAEESISDEETPLAQAVSGWALLNLILAIVTAIGAVVLVIGYFAGYTAVWRLLSLIPGIGGVVAFFLTEDMSQAMTFVDGWTVLMVILAVVQIVLAVLSRKAKYEEEDDGEEEA